MDFVERKGIKMYRNVQNFQKFLSHGILLKVIRHSLAIRGIDNIIFFEIIVPKGSKSYFENVLDNKLKAILKEVE